MPISHHAFKTCAISGPTWEKEMLVSRKFICKGILPKFPIVQIAGHSPAILFIPGRVTAVSISPPVKQNLFHVDIIPPS